METLRKISQSSSGRTPSFTEAYALKAIELIGEGASIGRQQLSRELRLGGGTIRTLVSRLKGLGLVGTSRGGMKLTPKGLKLLNEFKEKITAGEFPETDMTIGPRNFAILVRDAGRNVSKGIEQRDAALIAGAEGATTLVYDGGRLQMPGVEMDVDPSTEKYVLEKWTPGEGDVVIIGSASDPFDAEMGAKSAALKLLEMLNDPKA